MNPCGMDECSMPRGKDPRDPAKNPCGPLRIAGKALGIARWGLQGRFLENLAISRSFHPQKNALDSGKQLWQSGQEVEIAVLKGPSDSGLEPAPQETRPMSTPSTFANHQGQWAVALPAGDTGVIGDVVATVTKGGKRGKVALVARQIVRSGGVEIWTFNPAPKGAQVSPRRVQPAGAVEATAVLQAAVDEIMSPLPGSANAPRVGTGATARRDRLWAWLRTEGLPLGSMSTDSTVLAHLPRLEAAIARLAGNTAPVLDGAVLTSDVKRALVADAQTLARRVPSARHTAPGLAPASPVAPVDVVKALRAEWETAATAHVDGLLASTPADQVQRWTTLAGVQLTDSQVTHLRVQVGISGVVRAKTLTDSLAEIGLGHLGPSPTPGVAARRALLSVAHRLPAPVGGGAWIVRADGKGGWALSASNMVDGAFAVALGVKLAGDDDLQVTTRDPLVVSLDTSAAVITAFLALRAEGEALLEAGQVSAWFHGQVQRLGRTCPSLPTTRIIEADAKGGRARIVAALADATMTAHRGALVDVSPVIRGDLGRAALRAIVARAAETYETALRAAGDALTEQVTGIPATAKDPAARARARAEACAAKVTAAQAALADVEATIRQPLAALQAQGDAVRLRLAGARDAATAATIAAEMTACQIEAVDGLRLLDISPDIAPPVVDAMAMVSDANDPSVKRFAALEPVETAETAAPAPVPLPVRTLSVEEQLARAFAPAPIRAPLPRPSHPAVVAVTPSPIVDEDDATARRFAALELD